MSRASRYLLPNVTALALIGLSNSAYALNCDEIMNMVSVNVPTNIVVQTMKDSGDQFTPDEIACLQRGGAPTEVLNQARSMAASGAPERNTVPDDQEEQPSSRRSSLEQDSDDISERSSRRGSSSSEDELPERGAEDDRDPENIKQAVKLLRSKKPLTATLMLYEMKEDGSYPDQETKIDYYLARGFADLEMYHAAQYHYLQVVKKGVDNPYFSYALPNLVKIARYTGDDTELLRIVSQIPPESYPRGAKNQLYYLTGLRYYGKEELNKARQYFGEVSSKSDLYLRSKYFEGVIYNQQGKLKSAVRSFRDVYREEVEVYNDARELKEVEQLKDLSLINIARIYYGLQRFDESTKYYDLVSHESIYWPQSLFENAWSNFMQNNLNETLGQLLTVKSPFYLDNEFVPEATVLRALTFFNLCKYDEVEKILLTFEKNHRPIQEELRDFVQQYATEEGKQLADQAWDHYFTGQRNDSTLIPKSAFDRVLRNKDLQGIVRHLEVMDEEEALIDEQKSRWNESVGTYLKKVLEADRERYKRRAGRLMLAEMARTANYLSDLLTQSEIIRFEVVDAQRVDYQYKAQTMDLSGGLADKEIDFATSVEYVYWPFNGEFWKDELGYYVYTEQSDCK